MKTPLSALTAHLQIALIATLVLSCAVALGLGDAPKTSTGDSSPLFLAFPKELSVHVKPRSLGSVRIYRAPDCAQCSKMIQSLKADRVANPSRVCLVLFDQPADAELISASKLDKGIVLVERSSCPADWKSIFPGKYTYDLRTHELKEVRS